MCKPHTHAASGSDAASDVNEPVCKGSNGRTDDAYASAIINQSIIEADKSNKNNNNGSSNSAAKRARNCATVRESAARQGKARQGKARRVEANAN